VSITKWTALGRRPVLPPWRWAQLLAEGTAAALVPTDRQAADVDVDDDETTQVLQARASRRRTP